MRNFMNGISKGLAFVLAAAMVFTSVPSPVFADTLSLDTAVESDELTDAASAVDASAEISDSQVATDGDLIDSGIEVAAETAEAADLEATNEGEEVDIDGAADTVRTITVTAPSGVTNINSLRYGEDFTTITSRAQVNGADYKDVDWSLMSIDSDDTTAYNTKLGTYNTAQGNYTAAQTAANKKALTDARTELIAFLSTPEALPSGMTGTKNATSGAFEFKGPKALEVYDKYFVLVATDNDGTTAGNVGYSAPFEIKVKGVNVDAGRSGNLAAYYNSVGSPKMQTPGVVVTTSAGGAKDGYEVYASATEATAAGATNYALSMPVILNVTAASNIDSNGAVVLSDASYKITNSSGKNGSVVDYFTVTANSTKLYSGSDGYVTLTVTPKKGLLSFGGSKTYQAFLHISSTAAFEEDVVVELNFTVGQNITFSEKINDEDNDEYTAVTLTSESAKGFYNKSGSDYVLVTSDTAVSGTYYIKDLGTYGVGQDVGTIKITATSGGNDNLTITKAASDSIPEGLHVAAVKGKTATYTITGAAEQAAGATYDFMLTAKDEDTNNSLSIWYRLTTTDVTASTTDVPGLDISIGTEKYTTGSTYDWYVGPSADDKAIDVVITNATATELELRPAFTKIGGAGTISVTPVISLTDDITLAAGGSVTYKLTPSTTKSAPDTITGTFEIVAGTGIANQVVNLTYSRIADAVSITNPKSDEATDNALTAATIGLPYDGFTFSATTDTTYSIAGYEIVDKTEKAAVANPDVADIANYYDSPDAGSPTSDGALVPGKIYYATNLFQWDKATKLTGGTTPTKSAAAAYSFMTADDLETKYGLVLNKPTGLFTTVGDTVTDDGSGPATVYLLVRATYYNGTKPGYVYRIATLAVGVADVKDAIAISYNGASLNDSTANSFTMDKAGMGDTVKPSADVDIVNNLGVNISAASAGDGVCASIKSVKHTSTDGLTTKNYSASNTGQKLIIDATFEITYPSGVTPANGIELDAGEASKFTLVTKAAPSADPDNTNPDNGLAPGTYEITMTVESNALTTPYDIVAELTINAAPVIETSITNTIDDFAANVGFEYGKEVESDGTYSPLFVAHACDDTLPYTTTGDYRFSWAKSKDSILDITQSGMTISESGTVQGEPILAGTFDVDITATHKDDASIKTTIPYTFVVAGSATLSVVADSTTITGGNEGKTYVMPGIVQGTAGLAQLKITNNTGTNVEAKNIKVTITNAEDDRDTTQPAGSATAKDIIANPDNPYETNNSKQYFVPDTNNFNLAKDELTNVKLNIPKTTPAGEYKVKVTIGGTNVTETSFYIYLAVVPELVCADLLSANGNVGEAYNVDVKASGAAKDQTITYAWDATVEAKPAWLTLADATDPNTGLVKGSMTGTPTASFDKDVRVKASVTATGTFSSKSIKTDTTTYPLVTNTVDVYPAQSAEANFHITIAPATNVKLGLSYVAGTWTAPKSTNVATAVTTKAIVAALDGVEYDTETGIDGDKEAGSKYSEIRGYAFKPLSTSYAAAERSKAIITINNGTTATLSNVLFDLNGSEDFTLGLAGDDTNTYGTKKISGKTYITKTLDPGPNYIIITPAEGLSEGTHTTTLKIFSNDVTEIPFTLTQVVEPASYHATLDFVENAGTGTYNTDKDLDEFKAAIGSDATAPSAITLAPRAKGASIAAGTSLDMIYVTNTGNKSITDVSIMEVDANGNAIEDAANEKLQFTVNSGASLVDGSATLSSSLAPDAHVHFTIVAKSTTEAKEVNDAYVRVSYRGATGSPLTKIMLPVKYVIYNSGLSNLGLTPATNPIVLDDFSEGADPKTATGGQIVLKNNNEAGGQNTLYNVNVSIAPTSVDPEAFKILYDGKVNNTATIESLTTGSTATIAVVPAEDLAYGEYEATLSIMADNMAAPVLRDVKVKITQSQSYDVDVFTNDASAFNPAVAITDSHAQRLYNTLSAIVAADDKNKNTVVAYSGNTGTDDVFYINLDSTKKHEITAAFTGTYTTSAGNPASGISDVKITRDDAQNISVASLPITLSTKEVDTVRSYTSGTTQVKDGYFDSVNFNLWSTVTLVATYHANPTVAEFISGTEEAFEAIDGVAVWGTEVKDSTTKEVIGITGASTAVGPVAVNDAITVLVPNGRSVASVLGNLPRATKTGYAFEGWETTIAGVKSAVDTSTAVTKDADYTIKWHTHEYPTSWDETETNKSENPNVVWTWTKDPKTGKYIDAEVTIYCTNSICPDRAKSALTFKTSGTSPVITFTGEKAEATCVQGERYEYTATINPTTTTGSPVFTSKRSTNEDKSTIFGHDYKPTITWAYDEEAKKFKATIVVECQREGCTDETEGHKVTATTVNVKDEVKVEPTCTKEGQATYTIESFVAGGKTYTPADFAKYTTITWDTTEVLPALGHTPVQNFILSEDKKTATGTVICSVCNEYLVGTADKPATVAVTLGKDDKGLEAYVGTAVGTDSKTYTIYAYDHVHVWDVANIDWKYDAAGGVVSNASATFTCNPVGAASHKMTVPATVSEPTADGSYKKFTIKATSPAPDEKEYTKEVTLDGSGKDITGVVASSKWTAAWNKDGFNFATGAGTIIATLTGENGEVDIQTAVVSSKTNSKGVITYTALVTDRAKKSHKNVWTYDPATGTVTDKGSSSSGGGESGDTPSEPDNSSSWNLFYTDNDINIAVPSNIKTDDSGNVAGSGKWTGYYKVDGSGHVTVTGDPKNAAKAANSVIVAPLMGTDDSGNAIEIGEFEYSLPVSYVKPSLKLTSTSGTVNKTLGVDQTVVTGVLEKKSSGAFEPLDVSDQDPDKVAFWAAKSGSAKVEAGNDFTGQLNVTAQDKASGKIQIQLPNWNEKIELSYSVKAATKDVLTTNAKQVILNTNAVSKDVQTVNVMLNNAEISSSDDGVTIELPKKWAESGVQISSGATIAEGALTGTVDASEISFAYGSTLKKGSYTVTFKKGNVKASVKVVVSDAQLTDKTVSLKVKSKLNSITGQKMVLEPTLKGISGTISDVAFDSEETVYEADWDESRGTIIVGFQEGKTASKGKYDKTLFITVASETVKVPIKVQVVETTPTVKVDKVTLPKSKFSAGTAEGAANILSTYKLGGKTFTIAPSKVEFDGGVAVEGEDGWFSVSKAGVKVYYNQADGTIEVKSLSGSTKAGNVKVKVSYTGLTKTVNKTLSVKLDKNK